MDVKKDFLHRNIKQETENEPYSSAETFPSNHNLPKVKFEEPIDVNVEANEITCVEDDFVSAHSSLNEYKSCAVVEQIHESPFETSQSMCRLCAKPINSTKMYLYDDNELEQKINYALPIRTALGDGLPEYICQNCDVNLQLFYDFVCCAVDADKTLRRLNMPDVKTSCEAASSVRDISPEAIEMDNHDSDYAVKGSGIEQLFEECSADVNFNKKSNKRLRREEEHFELSQKFKTHQNIAFVKMQVGCDEQYKCQHCEQTFISHFTFTDHIEQCEKTTRYRCPETDCTENFASAKSLNDHISNSHHVPVICYKCGKIFLHQEALDKHHQNMHFYKVCKDCGMAFKSTLSFKTHTSLHAACTKHQCVYCFKCFGNHHTLCRHTRQCHSGNFTLLVNADENNCRVEN